MLSRLTLLSKLALLPVLLVLGAHYARGISCRSVGPWSPSEGARHQAKLAAVPLGQASGKPKDPKEPRLILTPSARARLKRIAQQGDSTWANLKRRCDQQSETLTVSGYQAFEWADAVAGLSLCYHATGDEDYAERAVVYLEALLDDRFEVGDGKGGNSVVHHDSGYGIRTFGAYSALGYDWLRAAPSMTDAIRQKVLERLEAWIAWYQEEGYLNDTPLANYYWGYFTTLAFAGLVFEAESPQGKAWLEQAKQELSTRVLPAFKTKLPGGGWPEGWQYGEYVATEAALVARGFQTATGLHLIEKLPWLRQVVTHHVHALLPDEQSVYDGGTWGEHPAKPSAIALSAAAIALEGYDDRRAAQARWMVANVLPPLRREHSWLAFLAAHPRARQENPRHSAPISYHVRGSGLSLMRSGWDKQAYFASFQAGPRLAVDHQHKDQGHFELWRGPDALIVDGGNSEGAATINHNSLLIDDGGRRLTYPPNQGVWGYDVRTTRFGDDGRVVAVTGDITEAYAPACVREGCRERTVERALRSLVYVRPSLLVIEDRVRVERASDSVTWAAHVPVAPRLAKDRATAFVGTSRLDVLPVWPRGLRIRALKEPTPSGTGPHRANLPRGDMWRLEVPTLREGQERRLVHWIFAGEKSKTKPAVYALQAKGFKAFRSSLGERSVVVAFANTEAGGNIELGARADEVVIAGLAPDQRYSVGVERARCVLSVREASQGEFPENGGFIRVSARRCAH